MKKFLNLIFVLAAFCSSSCNRAMDSDVYTEANTVSIVLEGEIVSVRKVTIKANDKLEDNKLGGLAGGIAGGVGGSEIGKGKGSTLGAIGGAVAGAALGAVVQDALSTSSGMEYIVKVVSDDVTKNSTTYTRAEFNRSVLNNLRNSANSGEYKTRLISVVQGVDVVFAPGQKVYVLYSDDNKARLVAR